jgi:nucleoside-specific outer membrane channel protein Tsx
MLLEITTLGKEKNQCIKEKTGTQNIVNEIKQYQKKWLQHVQKMDTQNTKISTTIENEMTKEHRTTKEEMEGPTSY